MDILKELYYGKISGAERKMDKKEKIYSNKELYTYKILKQKLSPNDIKLVEEYLRARDERETISLINTYKLGFKTGLQIGIQSIKTN